MNQFELIKNNYPYYWLKKSDIKSNSQSIVYIHGFGDHPRWMFEHFNKINYCDIFCIELPGHWQTPLRDIKQLDPISFAHEIIDLIEKLGLKDIILIGHSMGGGIAMMINLIKPEFINKMILISPMNSHAIGLKQIYNFLFKFNGKKKNKKFYELLVNKRCVQKLYEKTINDLKNNFDKRNKNYKILTKNILKVKNIKTLKKSEKKINKKTLLILGEIDNIINSKKTMKYFKNNNNFIIKSIKNTGHMPFYEEKEIFYQFIDNFINDLI